MLINKNQRIYLYLFCIFSLIISFIIGENSSGGSKLDNQITRQYIDGFLTGYSFGIKYFINTSQVQSPIFYIIIATLEKILGKFFLQYFYIFITSLIPIIFYISLKKKFRNVNRNYLFFLSLIFFLSPFFRSSAVWITTDNLAILFYILSISKYLSSKKNNTKNILQCLTYLSIAVYLRQYYIIFFLFYFIKFIELLNVKKLFLISLFQLLIFIPLLFYYYYYLQFDMSKLNIVNLDSHPFKLDPFKNLLIFLSLYFFYTLPLYANVLLEIKRDIIKYFFYNLILVFIFIFIYFSYEIIFDELGGGVFVKISKILDIKELFFIASFLGALLMYRNINTNNLIIYFCLIFAFPVEIIYQKYYDPLLILTIFTLTKSDTINKLIQLKKINLKFLYLYFFSFLIISNIYY